MGKIKFWGLLSSLFIGRKHQVCRDRYADFLIWRIWHNKGRDEAREKKSALIDEGDVLIEGDEIDLYKEYKRTTGRLIILDAAGTEREERKYVSVSLLSDEELERRSKGFVRRVLGV